MKTMKNDRLNFDEEKDLWDFVNWVNQEFGRYMPVQFHEKLSALRMRYCCCVPVDCGEEAQP